MHKIHQYHSCTTTTHAVSLVKSDTKQTLWIHFQCKMGKEFLIGKTIQINYHTFVEWQTVAKSLYYTLAINNWIKKMNQNIFVCELD